ncbi:hypothetical protein Dda_1829 [Drechslerella dactyloides]|uniref:NAD-dependent epimerase/dehydratase domain-containing protein n=1 Tax=Drechslerella dactyloides TaxID=74499 RepID=A0AAD6J2M6_DREDA|nr:hypothetical protein Dda_1829 [Drechslerella dactyloides]
MATQKCLAVIGGNGFLGKQKLLHSHAPTPCIMAAIQRNWKVISLSRSGEPDWKHSSQNGNRPDWAENVTWVSADVFEPATYKSHLTSADAVVHSMGLLLEADYKGVLQGKENPITGLRKAFQESGNPWPKSENPLEKVPPSSDAGSESTSSEAKQPLTYERINRDSALIAAKSFVESSKAERKTFVYISAAAGFPVLPQRYISTKRETEELLAQVPDFRSIFFRPGFMYSSERPATVAMSYLTRVSATMNSITGKVFSGLFGAAGASPLQAENVGRAVVRAIEDEAVKGPVEVAQIETLNSRLD